MKLVSVIFFCAFAVRVVCVSSVFRSRLNFVVLIDRMITTLFLFKHKSLICPGGYCQRGVIPLVFIPPFDTIFFLMAKENIESNRSIHIYCFESENFYVNIKAYNMNEAINNFKLLFGSCCLTYVKQIISSEYGKN